VLVQRRLETTKMKGKNKKGKEVWKRVVV